jgi:signal transduction histidine kinase
MPAPPLAHASQHPPSPGANRLRTTRAEDDPAGPLVGWSAIAGSTASDQITFPQSGLVDWWPAGVWVLCCALAILAAHSWRRLRKAQGNSRAAVASNEPLAKALAEAQRRIGDFTASQERFVGNLAQEIKVPIGTLLMHADLLAANGHDQATVSRYTRGIAEDLRHLSDLVESFLRLARPFAQEDTSKHLPVHFHDLVLEAVRRCQSLAASRAVDVVPMLAESAGNHPVEVMGDAVLLEAMIENLVRNGVLAAPRGTRVHLHVRAKGDAVVLSVRDQGPKIEDERLESVFEGFFQIPAPPRPSVGTGLSLAIAKRVAEHHRGTISLRNVPEGGCEFAVELPRWHPPAAFLSHG